jgi:hypothetical protein
MIQWLKKVLSDQRLAFSKIKNAFADCYLLIADGCFSCGFRSDHSCGAAAASYHLPFPLALFQKVLFVLLF